MAQRFGRLRRSAALLALAAVAYGPATSLARAVHLHGAAHDHAADSCHVCQDLTLGTTAPALDAPVTLANATPAVERLVVPATPPPARSCHLPDHPPRAPPAS